jgi:hypothetical protein
MKRVMLLVAALMLMGLASGSVLAEVVRNAPPAELETIEGPTSLTVWKTVDDVSWERDYDWTITKSVEPTSLELILGQHDDATYTLNAEREVMTDTYTVAGTICAKNDVEHAAQLVDVVDCIEYKPADDDSCTNEKDMECVDCEPGCFQTLVCRTIQTGGELAPGEKACWDYSVSFTPVPGAIAYRNRVEVKISNHPDGMHTFLHRKSFAPPASPMSEVDECATIVDELTVPDGFSVASDYPDEGWETCDSETFTIHSTITNTGALGEHAMVNVATVTEGDSGDTSSSAPVSLDVDAGTPSYIAVSPEDATIMAGEVQTYTARAYDGDDRLLGDVTAETTFEIDEEGHGGSWDANVYTGGTAGIWTVVGTYDGLTDTTDLTVTAGAAAALVITPDGATIAAGEVQTYTAETIDGYGNVVADVTMETTFEIDEEGHGGSWDGNVYTGGTAGTWTIVGAYDGLTDTTDLTVTAGAGAALVIAPDGATIAAGEEQTYTAETVDGYGNMVADVTAETTFEIDEEGHGGSWDGNIYTGGTAGIWTVVGAYDGLTDTTDLTVTAGAAAALVIVPDGATIAAGEEQTYTAATVDGYGNVVADVTAETTFEIDEEGHGGSWDGNIYTGGTAGTWTVVGAYDGLTDTVTLEVEGPAPAPDTYKIYLPFVAVVYPDLVVEEVTVTSDSAQVVVTNQGPGPVFFDFLAPTSFRVDLYIDPDPVPDAVNQTWDDGRCTYGAAWIVTDPALSRWRTLTLTLDDDYYQADLSNLPDAIPVGSTIYVQVDSYDPGKPYGSVLEDHESAGGSGVYNNIFGPVLSTAATDN